MSIAPRTLLAIAGVLLALPVWGCSSTPTAPATNTYIDQEKGFTLVIPGDWRKQSGGPGEDLEIVLASQTDAKVVRDTLSVHMERLTKPMTLNEYFAAKAAGPEHAGPELELKILSKSNATLGGQEARRMVYSMLTDKGRATSTVWFLVKEGRGYQVMATAADERFADAKARLEEIAGTLKLEAQ
jgi:hypothetical protein